MTVLRSKYELTMNYYLGHSIVAKSMNLDIAVHSFNRKGMNYVLVHSSS